MSRKDQNLLTPLQLAAERGDVEQCRKLITGGADVNELGKVGETPLRCAASQGFVEVCSLLIASGASIDLRESTAHLTPLLSAASFGRRDTVRFLIERGADVSLTGVTRRGVAMIAVKTGNVELCQDLVDMGVSMSARDSMGFGPLHIVSRPQGRGDLNVRLLDFLVASGVDPNALANDGYSALDYAIRSRDLGTCRELVRLGAHTDLLPFDRKHDYMTPFQKAVYCGFNKAIEFFVTECGEDPAQRTFDDRTMVQLARKYPETKLLLRSLKTVFDVQEGVANQSGGGFSAAKGPKISGML